MVSISDKAALRLVQAGAIIRASRETPDQDKAFMARALVQMTLPHSDPGEATEWKRKNGWLTLTITPYRQGGRNLYPFGSIPRLLLLWIITEAVRTKNRRLELGQSLAEFMRQVGLSSVTGGGKRGDASRLRDQMVRLFRAHFTIEEVKPYPAAGMQWQNLGMVEHGEIWWSLPNASQPSLFGSYVVLGEAFFRMVTERPVPLDRRALTALRRSPLALDVYAWTSYRVFTLTCARQPKQFISWELLQDQFGADYADLNNFRKAFCLALRRVAQVYPELRYQPRKGGFYLFAGRPAVAVRIGGKNAVIPGETVPQRTLEPRRLRRDIHRNMR